MQFLRVTHADIRCICLSKHLNSCALTCPPFCFCRLAQIVDALSHATKCMDYMSRLANRDIFRFCAIPQIMAIGTLAACFNNHNVFTGVVKMRRGETAKIWWHLDDFADACALFRVYARQISAQAQVQAGNDPHVGEILEACEKIEAAAVKHMTRAGKMVERAQGLDAAAPLPLASRFVMLLAALLYCAYAWQIEEVRALMGLPHRSYSSGIDVFNRGVAAVLLGYAVVVAFLGRRLTT